MSLVGGLASLARPLHMGMAAIAYLLGVGIARYLGNETILSLLVLGLIGVLLGQGSMGLLEAAFRPAQHALFPRETPEERRALRDAALYAAMGAVSALGITSYLIFSTGRLTAPVLVNQILGLTVILLFAIPPMRVADRGLGELMLAVQISHVSISAGFLLQAGGPHPLVYLCIGSLTLLLMSTLVALDFPSFGQDLSRSRVTLVTRVGWENALRIHHTLLAAAYVILAAAPFSGFALERFLPAFLTIPFAVLQAYLLQQVAAGAKPMWRLLRANAVALFALTAYLLTLSFWFH